jgi:hypothetical protein
VSKETQPHSSNARLPITPTALGLKNCPDVTGDHGDDESGGVKRNDVVEFEGYGEEVGEEEGKVVDAEDHGDETFDGIVGFFVEVKEVTESSLIVSFTTIGQIECPATKKYQTLAQPSNTNSPSKHTH